MRRALARNNASQLIFRPSMADKSDKHADGGAAGGAGRPTGEIASPASAPPLPVMYAYDQSGSTGQCCMASSASGKAFDAAILATSPFLAAVFLHDSCPHRSLARSSRAGGCAGYHAISREILATLPRDAICLAWDDREHWCDKADIEAINRGKKGFGGTSPVVIARALGATGFNGHLIILTDGEVGNADVDAADAEMRRNGVKLARVTVYLVGRAPNLS